MYLTGNCCSIQMCKSFGKSDPNIGTDCNDNYKFPFICHKYFLITPIGRTCRLNLFRIRLKFLHNGFFYGLLCNVIAQLLRFHHRIHYGPKRWFMIGYKRWIHLGLSQMKSAEPCFTSVSPFESLYLLSENTEFHAFYTKLGDVMRLEIADGTTDELRCSEISQVCCENL